MELWRSVLELFDARMEKPVMFGWFHLLFFAIAVIAGIVLCLRFPNPSEKFTKRLLLGISITVIIAEIYKQINFSFSYTDNIVFDYQWYAFPFQFCSTPMYVGLLAGLLKGRVHRALCAYLATFALFAGLSVMFYPSTVFIDVIGINIQTMICHGSMVTIGIYLLGSGYVSRSVKTIIPATTVFIIFVAIAAALNEIAHRSGLLERETFNMFFISPYCDPELPVYSLVQGVVPFPLSLVIYVIGFTAAAFVILAASMGISAIIKRLKQKKLS